MGRFVIKNRGKMGLHDGKLMLADTKKQTRDFMREKIVQTLLYDGRFLSGILFVFQGYVSGE